MYKKTITYTDYNGVERVEDFYFNFTRAELMDMETSEDGSLSEKIQKIINSKDVPSIIKVFKKIVLDAYGEKSPDGRRFIKSDELREAFSQTEAYSDLFMELASDADKASEFMNGVVPGGIDIEEAKKMLPNA